MKISFKNPGKGQRNQDSVDWMVKSIVKSFNQKKT